MTRKQKNGSNMDNTQHNREDYDGQSLVEVTESASQSADDEVQQKRRSTTMPPAFEHAERYHEAGTRDVELYIRTYNTLLRSSGEISLKALVQAHYNIDSSLHPDARSPYPDMSAFIYSVLS